MDTITISRADYEALIMAKEDLDDIRAYDRAMADCDEGMPHELVARLIDDEAPLTVFREWRGFSKAALAKASGVDRVQITDIEAGRKTGSVATLKKLAEAMGVQIDELVV